MVPLAEHSIVQTVKLQQLTKNTEKYNASFKSKTHGFCTVGKDCWTITIKVPMGQGNKYRHLCTSTIHFQLSVIFGTTCNDN